MLKIRTGLAVLTLSVLAACASHDPVAKCRGPVFQLNANHWQPQAADLKKPKEMGHQ